MAVGPPGPYVQRLRELGCQVECWPLDRRSLNPVTELRSLWYLYQIYLQRRPTVAHHFTIKPNLYGAIAARLARVPAIIATVTGLGYFWTESDGKTRRLRLMLTYLYKAALRQTDAVVFHNDDDRRLLGNGYFAEIIPGEGVNTSLFHPEAISQEQRAELRIRLGIEVTAPVALMISRMLWHKGVGEFVAAARLVRRKMPEAVFLLVGPPDEGNPASISSHRLQAWAEEGVIRYLGFRQDIPQLLALADVAVLPSYREGIPQVLVEAAAMGKPLVATDVPGCGEVVLDGVNGLRVPPRDPEALAEAIIALLADPVLRESLGKASRTLAEERFATEKIVQRWLFIYKRVLEAKGYPFSCI